MLYKTLKNLALNEFIRGNSVPTVFLSSKIYDTAIRDFLATGKTVVEVNGEKYLLTITPHKLTNEH